MRGWARSTHTASRERKTRCRFISLFITNLRPINIDGHIVDPLSLNTRDLVCLLHELWTIFSTNLFLNIYYKSRDTQSRSPNSNGYFFLVAYIRYLSYEIIFFIVQLVGRSKHALWYSQEGNPSPPAHSRTVTGVDDLSLSSSVISVGRTRWHLAVKNISSVDVPQARALFVRLSQVSEAIVANLCASRSNYAGREV